MSGKVGIPVFNKKSPPLGGGSRGTPRHRGGVKKKKVAPEAPLGLTALKKPWYQCKRCRQMVLSYKRSRVLHRRNCPLIPILSDPTDLLVAIMTEHHVS